MKDLPNVATARATHYATIQTGKYISAQGQIIDKMADGRVTIDAGGRQVTGRPV